MKRPYRASYYMLSLSFVRLLYMYGMQQLCVQRLALSGGGGVDLRGNGLENQRDVSDGNVSDVSGEKGKKELTVTPPSLFCLSSRRSPICTST